MASGKTIVNILGLVVDLVGFLARLFRAPKPPPPKPPPPKPRVVK